MLFIIYIYLVDRVTIEIYFLFGFMTNMNVRKKDSTITHIFLLLYNKSFSEKKKIEKFFTISLSFDFVCNVNGK